MENKEHIEDYGKCTHWLYQMAIPGWPLASKEGSMENKEEHTCPVLPEAPPPKINLLALQEKHCDDLQKMCLSPHMELTYYND